MYKTVVFDLDGTLLNTLTDLADAGNRLCRKYGWPTHERQAYRYFVGNGIPKLVERLAPADQRTPAVLEAALADFKRDYGQHLRDTTAPYPGIPEMLAKLKANGVQLAVFSNKADALAKEVVKDYFGTQYFTIVRGQMTGVAPSPPPRARTPCCRPCMPTRPAPCMWGTATWMWKPPTMRTCPAAGRCGDSARGRN